MAEEFVAWNLPYTAQQIQDAQTHAVPIIGDNGHWLRWDIERSAWQDTGITASTGLADGSVTWEKLAQSARHSNPNLLINADFRDPINQRGVSGTITTPGYFIDCWKLLSGTVQITASGLVLNGEIAQILETAPSGTVTASALTTTGLVTPTYSVSDKTFTITGTGQTFVAAALELGDSQTHFHQDADGNWVRNTPPPDRALELAKCQRYFVPINSIARWMRIRSSFGGSAALVFQIPVPTTMRAKPVITGDVSKLRVSAYSSPNTIISGLTFDVGGYSPGQVNITVKGTDLPTDAMLSTNTVPSVSVPGPFFDANL